MGQEARDGALTAGCGAVMEVLDRTGRERGNGRVEEVAQFAFALFEADAVALGGFVIGVERVTA